MRKNAHQWDACIEGLESRRLLSGALPQMPLQMDTIPNEQSYRDSGFVQMDWQGSKVWVKPGEWNVGFKKPVTPLFPDDVGADDYRVPTSQEVEALGLGIRAEPGIAGSRALTIHVPDNIDYETLRNALSKLAGFESLSPNFAMSTSATIPSDTYFTLQYGLNNTGQTDVFPPPPQSNVAKGLPIFQS